MLRTKATHILHILAILLLLPMGACRDEELEAPVKEGEDTYVSLSIELPQTHKFEVSTRADISTQLKNKVNNLWVAVYSATSGERVYEGYRTYSDEKPDDHEIRDWGNIKAKSGRMYIVAVANSANQSAFDVNRPDEKKDLHTLLQDADTWTKFRALSIEQLAGNVYAPNPSIDAGIVMSGCYYAQKTSDPDSWENEGAVVISTGGTQARPVTLPGAIHLRMPYSQIMFNVEPDQDVIDLTVNSYQVMNVPTYFWVYERRQQNPSASNRLGFANAGDAMNPYFQTNDNYTTSYLFTSADMKVTQKVEGADTDQPHAYNTYSFDFWLPENKRTGLESCREYTDRQVEWQNALEDAPADKSDIPNLSNTGIYKSLCPTPAGSLNNNATYVVLDCDIRYIDRVPSTKPGPGNTTIDLQAIRTAHTQYVIHLGYLNKVATDFNSLRNSIYTYNVKVTGCNNVLVEAKREGERQPSAEGIVSDTEEGAYDLDAHYHAFNVFFTKQEIEDPEFTFIMETWDNGQKYTYESGGSNIPARNSSEWKYYNWVQLVRKTDTDKSKLEKYPGDPDNPSTPEANKKNVIYLNDIRSDFANLLKTDPDAKEIHYTVFVNEYAYEKGADETGGNWKGYVNQQPRRFWLRVKQSVSNDGESTYYSAKYSISQKSIQTFYNPAAAYPSGQKPSAFGLERYNENFGMNVGWGTGSASSLSNSNGRLNVWNALGNSKQWDDYIIPTSLQSINAIGNTNQQYYGLKAARNEYLPMISTTLSSNTYNSDYYPQTNKENNQYYNAMFGCMNRNRDDNGNGTIDAEELKWVLPTTGTMLRIIIGEKGLASPLINYSKETLPFFCGYGQNPLYHYATSDGRIVWTEEGLSTSSLNDYGNNWNKAPWEIRCVRNLGTNLSASDISSEPQTAYTSDIDKTLQSGVIKVPYYYGSSVRLNSPDPLPINKILSDENKPAMYGFEIAPRGNGNPADNKVTSTETVLRFGNNPSYMTYTQLYDVYQNTLINNADVCNSLNTSTGRRGWRLPNQREIAIMFKESGLLEFSGITYFLTCTQEYWAGTGASPTGSLDAGQQYRVLTVQSAGGVATFLRANGGQPTDSGSPFNFGIRCVRDLTAAEAGMSYNQIKAYKQPSYRPAKKAPKQMKAKGIYKAADAGIL